jgi:hypothetical protein
MKPGCADLATLLSYWLGELDEPREAAIEQHYLGCGVCSARLADVETLADGVRRAFASGHLPAVLTPAFVERMRAEGLRLREYRVPCNGSVNCSVAVEDQVLVSRLQAPLEGVGRVDALIGEARVRLEDIPFDAASGEVVLAPGIERIRAMPPHRHVVRLVAIEGSGERVLGDYTFNHT